ncbi:hypothetical protein [Nonlabens ulvanivorans]|uniref:hypothetical protein n=1 Tax=Nonlabens ulvanivorans TaxID=906888 RepID=UPI0037C98F0C
MSWKKDDLLIKSKLFFEKAFKEDQEEIFFGLYCAMGLELLGRSAIANINTVLLAEPEKDQLNILHALDLSSVTKKKTIGTSQVFNLCKHLINEFTETNFKSAIALVNRRNEEVHTGTVAFEEYKTHQWIEGFYKCCKVLVESLGETLETIFDEEIAKSAIVFIEESDEKTLSKTKTLIAAHTNVFNAKDEDVREQLKLEAETKSGILSHKKHHKVECPACKCTGTVEGEVYGKINIENTEEEIITRQSVMPTKFNCSACELKLDSYAKLKAANISKHFTHRIHYSPEEYYDMISIHDEDAIDRYAEERGYFYFSND